MERAEVKVGVVDIGTNSVRLLVADIEVPADHVSPLERRVTITGLGRGVDATGLLDSVAIERTVEVLEDYATILSEAKVDEVRAVATSASRDAENREDFLARAGRALGIRPTVISGREEARLSFRGSTANLDSDPPYLVIDVGGGSTEFVMGSEVPEYSISIDMGSVRLTERTLPDRPAPMPQLAGAAREARRAFAAVEVPATPGTIVGVGGTFTSLSAISLNLALYHASVVHGSTLDGARLDRLIGFLAGLSVAETEAIPSLDPARAPVILAGAVVAREAVRIAGDGMVTVSESDILDGVALELAAAHQPG